MCEFVSVAGLILGGLIGGVFGGFVGGFGAYAVAHVWLRKKDKRT